MIAGSPWNMICLFITDISIAGGTFALFPYNDMLSSRDVCRKKGREREK